MTRWIRLIHAHTCERPVALLAILLLGTPAMAQSDSTTPAKSQANYSGSALFTSYCASCHGVAAKGDGPLADQLRIRPSDLTLLARHNKGKWDGEKVRRSIDGRDPLKGHGGTDMPVWGDAFKASREDNTEDAVKAKIEALVEHIQSIQAPPERGPADAGQKEP
jgi:mono/diheme cytochrome c family protein